jgi:hypothetical protein
MKIIEYTYFIISCCRVYKTKNVHYTCIYLIKKHITKRFLRLYLHPNWFINIVIKPTLQYPHISLVIIIGFFVHVLQYPHVGLLIVGRFLLHALQHSHIGFLTRFGFFLHALEYPHIGFLIIARFCFIKLALEKFKRMLIPQSNWQCFCN